MSLEKNISVSQIKNYSAYDAAASLGGTGTLVVKPLRNTEQSVIDVLLNSWKPASKAPGT